MIKTAAKSRIVDFAIAVAIAYALVAVHTATTQGDASELFMSVLFFGFSVAGPLIAVFSFWYAVPALAMFALLGALAFRRIESRAIRVPVLLALILLWLVYGIRCFTLITGGA